MWRRVRVGAAHDDAFGVYYSAHDAPGGGVRVSLRSSTDDSGGARATLDGALRLGVARGAVVWARADAHGTSLLVGGRGAAPHARASVTYVAHERSAHVDRLRVLTSVEPPWRSRAVRPFAYALPRNGVHLLPARVRAYDADARGSTCQRARARALALARIARERARVPASAWQVAAFIAREINSDADATGALHAL